MKNAANGYWIVFGKQYIMKDETLAIQCASK